jgi:hypothetical protein
MARSKDLGLEHTWRLRLRRQATGGLSIPEFCEREGGLHRLVLCLEATARRGAGRLNRWRRRRLIIRTDCRAARVGPTTPKPFRAKLPTRHGPDRTPTPSIHLSPSTRERLPTGIRPRAVGLSTGSPVQATSGSESPTRSTTTRTTNLIRKPGKGFVEYPFGRGRLDGCPAPGPEPRRVAGPDFEQSRRPVHPYFQGGGKPGARERG